MVTASQKGQFRFDSHELPGGAWGGIAEGESLTVIALERGRARIRVDGVDADLTERQCGLFITKEALAVLGSEDRSTRLLSCSVARSASPIVSRDGHSSSVLCAPTTDRVATLFRLGQDLSHADCPEQSRLRDMLGEALLQSMITDNSYRIDRSIPACIHRTRTYLDENFSAPCDLAQMAAAVGMRKERLVSTFRKHVGITPIRYLWDLRTRHSVHLVRTTQMTLAQIAILSGYKSHYHLSREVKRATGSTPRELRNARSGNAKESA